jgi:hypothetical protein
MLTGGVLDGDAQVPVTRMLAEFPVAVLSGEGAARATAETGSAVNVSAERCTLHPL